MENRHIFFQETWGVYKYYSLFIVTLHNFILSIRVGDSQSNDITIHNKDLTMVSEPMVLEGKNTPPPPPSPTAYNHSIELLKLIFKTICRQVLGLVHQCLIIIIIKTLPILMNHRFGWELVVYHSPVIFIKYMKVLFFKKILGYLYWTRKDTRRNIESTRNWDQRFGNWKRR